VIALWFHVETKLNFKHSEKEKHTSISCTFWGIN